jgi:hypothetical protein
LRIADCGLRIADCGLKATELYTDVILSEAKNLAVGWAKRTRPGKTGRGTKAATVGCFKSAICILQSAIDRPQL